MRSLNRRGFIAIGVSNFLLLSGCSGENSEDSIDAPISNPVTLEKISIINAHEIPASIEVRVEDDGEVLYQENVSIPSKPTDSSTIPVREITEGWGDGPIALNVRARITDLGDPNGSVSREKLESILAANQDWRGLPPADGSSIKSLVVTIAFGLDPGKLLIGSRPLQYK